MTSRAAKALAIILDPEPTTDELRLHERLIAAIPTMPPRTRNRVINQISKTVADEVLTELQVRKAIHGLRRARPRRVRR